MITETCIRYCCSENRQPDVNAIRQRRSSRFSDAGVAVFVLVDGERLRRCRGGLVIIAVGESG
jgi:hypothetical protein